ncbi:MAG: nucleotide exchange factor GrpE [Chloroflexota bacterium]
MNEPASDEVKQAPEESNTEDPKVEANRASRGAEARELERQIDDAREKVKQAETRADEAEKRAQENLDRWQRAQADLANFRRRSQFEREEMEKYAVAALVSGILPVLDSFDRAWQSLPGQLRRLTWLSGVAMIHSQLRGTLERIGLTEIEAEGMPFDPTLHEAVDREEHEGPPHVISVLQAGYKLHERVIRPALVKVGAKPPEAAPVDVSAPQEAAPEAAAPPQ